MEIGLYVLIALVLLALVVVKKTIVIIPQSETKIIERLGRYYATLKPGINIIIPFIDQAEAIAIQKITEAVGQSTNPANYLLAQKYITMMQEVAQGKDNKVVYLPYEATNLMGSIGGIKDLFNSK